MPVVLYGWKETGRFLYFAPPLRKLNVQLNCYVPFYCFFFKILLKVIVFCYVQSDSFTVSEVEFEVLQLYLSFCIFITLYKNIALFIIVSWSWDMLFKIFHFRYLGEHFICFKSSFVHLSVVWELYICMYTVRLV